MISLISYVDSDFVCGDDKPESTVLGSSKDYSNLVLNYKTQNFCTRIFYLCSVNRMRPNLCVSQKIYIYKIHRTFVEPTGGLKVCVRNASSPEDLKAETLPMSNTNFKKNVTSFCCEFLAQRIDRYQDLERAPELITVQQRLANILQPEVAIESNGTSSCLHGKNMSLFIC
jgi:hypothetical protein